MTKPVIAIAGLTACSGCQLTLFNCEEELPQVAERFSFASFPMGLSGGDECAPIDAAFVEGAVSTPEDLEILLNLRNRSRLLVAIGTCALWGGIAAMKNNESRKELAETIYGDSAHNIKTFAPGPLQRFVTVDFAITGCPPEKGELLTTLAGISRLSGLHRMPQPRKPLSPHRTERDVPRPPDTGRLQCTLPDGFHKVRRMSWTGS